MKVLIVVYIGFVIFAGIAILSITGVGPFLRDPPCTFCSGSGEDDDCPRHNKPARIRCLNETVKRNFQ